MVAFSWKHCCPSSPHRPAAVNWPVWMRVLAPNSAKSCLAGARDGSPGMSSPSTRRWVMPVRTWRQQAWSIIALGRMALAAPWCFKEESHRYEQADDDANQGTDEDLDGRMSYQFSQSLFGYGMTLKG